MKKTKCARVFLLLGLLLCLTTLLVVPAAASESQSGTCGDNASWSYDGVTLTISGTGDMFDYDVGTTPWYSARSTITSVVIDAGVTRIGDNAFNGCSNLQRVNFSDTASWSAWSTTPATASSTQKVESKLQYSYRDKSTTTSTASSLSGWTRYDSSTQYGSWGGWSGWQTSSVSGSDTRDVQRATVYGYYYFLCPNCGTHSHGWGSGACYTWIGGCGGYIPSSNYRQTWSTLAWQYQDWKGTGKYYTTGIDGSYWFQWPEGGSARTGWRYRDRSKTVTYYYYKWSDWSGYADTVYTATNTREVQTRTLYRTAVITDGTAGVTSIGEHAFSGTAIAAITIPDTVTGVGNYAFTDCDNLETVTLSKGMESISIGLFVDCGKLKAVTIPNGIKTIGGSAFLRCPALSEVTLPGTVTTIAGAAFCGSGLEEITLPASITRIGEEAFAGCTKLTEFTIPENVATLEGGFLDGCSGLTTIYYNAVNANAIPAIDGEVLGEVGASTDGVTLVFGDSVKNIPANLTFHSTMFSQLSYNNITSVVFGDSVESIGVHAFADLSLLREVTLPTSLTSIASEAFLNSDNLVSVFFDGPAPEMGENVFSISDLKNITIHYTSAVSTTFNTSYWRQYTQAVTAIRGTCGDNLKWYLSDGNLTITGTGEMKNYSKGTAPWYADYADYITTVGIASGVTNIGRYAFYDLQNLTTVDMRSGVTSIGANAFLNCKALTAITLPDTVVEVGNFAFNGCSGMQTVVLGSGVKRIGAGSFFNCTGIQGLYCYGESPTIGSCAFTNNTAMTVYYPECVSGYSAIWNGYPTEAMMLERINVQKKPTKLEYQQYGILDTTGMVVTATYGTGVAYTTEIQNGYGTDYSFDAVGQALVTVDYGGKIAVFNATVLEPTIVSIEVGTAPDTTEYVEGTEFSMLGVVLRVNWSNGRSTEVSDNITADYDFSSPGVKTVGLSYGGAETCLEVQVDPKEAVGISIEESGTPKSLYQMGERFDDSGLALYLDYNNGQQEPVSFADCALTYDFTSPGEKTVGVQYNGFSTAYTVTVEGESWPKVELQVARTAVQGSTISVTVAVSNNTPGLAEFQLRMTYDRSKFTYQGCDSDYEDILCRDFTNYLRINYQNGATIHGDATLVTLTFKVADDAAIGASDFAVTYVESATMNDAGETQPIWCVGCSTTITSYIIGDPTVDGVIDDADLTAILAYLNGVSELSENGMSAADINDDGMVTTADAALLLRYLESQS